MGTEVVPARDLTPRAVEVAALEAMKAVENVETPEEADRLLRMITAYQAAVKLAQIGRVHEQRWAGVRLRAERKMGELLGPATTGGQREGHVSGTNVEGAERVMQHQARKLAAVPEDVFTSYVETAEEPTRAGLLREAAKSVQRPEPEPPEERSARAINTHGAESSDRSPVVKITAEQLRDFDELRRFVAEGYRASGNRHSWVNRFKHGDHPLAFGFEWGSLPLAVAEPGPLIVQAVRLAGSRGLTLQELRELFSRLGKDRLDRGLAFARSAGRTIVSREKRANSAGRQQEQVVLRIGAMR